MAQTLVWERLMSRVWCMEMWEPVGERCGKLSHRTRRPHRRRVRRRVFDASHLPMLSTALDPLVAVLVERSEVLPQLLVGLGHIVEVRNGSEL